MDYSVLVTGLTGEFTEVLTAISPFLIAVLGARIGWKLIKGFAKSS